MYFYFLFCCLNIIFFSYVLTKYNCRFVVFFVLQKISINFVDWDVKIQFFYTSRKILICIYRNEKKNTIKSLLFSWFSFTNISPYILNIICIILISITTNLDWYDPRNILLFSHFFFTNNSQELISIFSYF